MKASAAIFSARFRTLLQYRAAAAAGLVCQIFFGLVHAAVLGAFYALAPKGQPLRLAEALTYVWLGQGFFRLIPMGVDTEVRALIRSGAVAYELARPLDLYNLWYTRSLASLTAPVLLRCAPVLLFAGLFMGLQPPVSLNAGLLFAAALGLAALLGAALMTLLTISLLWTLEGDGIARMTLIAVWIGSGIVLPLPLFPDALQALIAVLPFRGLLDTPFRLYMGHLAVADAPLALLHQWIWTLALVGLGRWALHRGIRRLVVQGG